MIVHRESMWTWPNERHVAAHDIQELGQFVEAGATKQPAYSGKTRIALLSLREGAARLQNPHCAEFVDEEDTLPQPIPFLPEKHWPATIDLDQESDEEENRKEPHDQ
jgi:hypothetical protein